MPQEALKRFKAILNPTQADWKKFYEDTAGGPVFEKALLDFIKSTPSPFKAEHQAAITIILSSRFGTQAYFLRNLAHQLTRGNSLTSPQNATASRYNQLRNRTIQAAKVYNNAAAAYTKEPTAQNELSLRQALRVVADAWTIPTVAALAGQPLFLNTEQTTQSVATRTTPGAGQRSTVSRQPQQPRSTTVAQSSTVPKHGVASTPAPLSRTARVASPTKSIQDQAQALWKQIAPQVEASLKQTGATVQHINSFLEGASQSIYSGIAHQYDGYVDVAYRLRDTFTPWGGESIEQLLDRVAYDARQNLEGFKDNAWSMAKGSVHSLTSGVDTVANFLVDGKRQQQALHQAAVITPRLLSLLGTAVQKDPQQAGHVFGAILTVVGLLAVGGGGGYAFGRSQQAKKIAAQGEKLEQALDTIAKQEEFIAEAAERPLIFYNIYALHDRRKPAQFLLNVERISA